MLHKFVGLVLNQIKEGNIPKFAFYTLSNH